MGGGWLRCALWVGGRLGGWAWGLAVGQAGGQGNPVGGKIKDCMGVSVSLLAPGARWCIQLLTGLPSPRCHTHAHAPCTFFPAGEVAEDLARYLLESEQVQSALGLGVSIGKDLR